MLLVNPTLMVSMLSVLLTTANSAVASESIKTSSSSPSIDFVEPPTNVTYQIYFNSKPGKKTIQITLSWLPSPNGRQPDGYEVWFLSLDKNVSNSCFNDFSAYIKPSIPASETSIEIPHDEHATDRKIVRFGCSYLAKIFSLPKSLPISQYAEKIVSIQACTEEDCGCKEPLPGASKLTVEGNKGDKAIISWIYPSNIDNITYFQVVTASSANPKPRGNIYRQLGSNIINHTREEYYSTNMTLSDSDHQRISVMAYDAFNCNRSMSQLILDCSSVSCFCTGNSLMAPVNITIAIETNESAPMAYISWFYPSYIQDVEAFEMAVGNDVRRYPVADSLSSPTPFGDNLLPSDRSYFTVSQPCDTEGGITYKILIRAIDHKSCYGPPRDMVYNCHGVTNFPSTSNENFNSDLLLIIGLCIGMILISIFICVWRKYYCPRKPLRTDKPYPMEPMNPHQHTYFPVENEHISPIYVPEEIDNALKDGRTDAYEISYSRLKIGSQIGKGAFGRVRIATTDAIPGVSERIIVAVKQLKEGVSIHEKEDFLAEIAMMKQVESHPNIVTMLACCTLQQPYCMVLEYVPCGDLQNYLRRLRDRYEKVHLKRYDSLLSPHIIHNGHATRISSSNMSEISVTDSAQPLLCYHRIAVACDNLPSEDYIMAADVNNEDSRDSEVFILQSGSVPTQVTYVCAQSDGCKYIAQPRVSAIEYCLDSEELHSFASQIARGMCHLSSKGITHRDLAARNILIDEKKTLKIADFGLSRTGIYVTKTGGRVPLRWLSLEAIKENIYSMESDVWAFGVVLWEICTLGGYPYAAINDAAIRQYLSDGNRLEKPSTCSDELYAVMEDCWAEDPLERPSFHKLVETLDEMKSEPHVYVNVDGDILLPPVEGNG